jgi:transcriptional regulator of nitric oxide reductase
MYGGGVDMDIAAGWKLSLLLRREHASGQDASTSFGLLLSFNPRAQPMSAPVSGLTDEIQATAKTGE